MGAAPSTFSLCSVSVGVRLDFTNTMKYKLCDLSNEDSLWGCIFIRRVARVYFFFVEQMPKRFILGVKSAKRTDAGSLHSRRILNVQELDIFA
ncbi:hypothetical protein RO07_18885 [Pandoraea pulmonicola]|uniref:Uncharacterized protein n=1 Tax=Pandoraea pulmonicola TaxID=93221 RepID=A0ABM5S2Q6_PANPU|nr:hypothetical protein RO07_18885 [Pandoraea pulmonicola]